VAVDTPAQAVLFDLDGTLVQTRAASWEVFQQISRRFALGIDSSEEYFGLFQDNLFVAIRKLCKDDEQAAEVAEAFLALLSDAYAPAMIPGMAEVVRSLAGHCTLAVMSSNAMRVIRRVLVENDLALCFAHVFGGDVTPDKGTAIRAFLADSGSGFGRRCVAGYDEAGRVHVPDPMSTVLVTDTAGDIRDALRTGIRVVGVAWGMHGVEELTAAGAEFVALWPQELSAHLLGPLAAAGPSGTCALPAPSEPSGPDCGCGCAGTGSCGVVSPDGDLTESIRVAGAVRRARRRPSPAAPKPPVPAELLSAIRRVCGSD
jgi:phosphoglycolate phosphatase